MCWGSGLWIGWLVFEKQASGRRTPLPRRVRRRAWDGSRIGSRGQRRGDSGRRWFVQNKACGADFKSIEFTETRDVAHAGTYQ